MLLSDFAFEFGDEVEQEADQAEGGFGAIEGLQAKAIRRKVLLELLDAVLALRATVVEPPDLHRLVTFMEFFTAGIRNHNTRMAYGRAVSSSLISQSGSHRALVLDPVLRRP